MKNRGSISLTLIGLGAIALSLATLSSLIQNISKRISSQGQASFSIPTPIMAPLSTPAPTNFDITDIISFEINSSKTIILLVKKEKINLIGRVIFYYSKKSNEQDYCSSTESPSTWQKIGEANRNENIGSFYLDWTNYPILDINQNQEYYLWATVLLNDNRKLTGNPGNCQWPSSIIPSSQLRTIAVVSGPTPTPTPTPSPSPSPTPTPNPTPTNVPISPTPTFTPTPPSSSENCLKKQSGDADCNGIINIDDKNIWLNSYRNYLSNKLMDLRADFNNDQKTDLLDYSIWRLNSL